jgi:RNA polymerase sigma factor (sigma-70 family)
MSALFRGLTAPSFDRLYQRHAPAVYRYVYAVLGNHADAEDVTQQTFLNAFRSMAQGTKPRKAENWLITIAHNEVRRHFRRTHGRPLEVELDERLPHPPKEVEDPSLADLLRALQHLPPEQRAALVMREFEGRSYKEIAQILGVTPDALEGLIFRARRGLAEHLEGALTCAEAEDALLRRLDSRLKRREAKRLKDHLHECQGCVRFATVQKRQRSLLKGLSVLPIPASLYLFRGEQAALAAGMGTATAAGGTAVAGGGGAAAATGAFGLVAKAAAVTASAAVVTGVGYGVSTGSATAAKPERKSSHVAAVEQTRDGQRALAVQTALASGMRPGPAAPANVRARKKSSKPKLRPISRGAAKRLAATAKQPAGHGYGLTKKTASPQAGRKPKQDKPPATPRAVSPGQAKKQRKPPPTRGRPVAKPPLPEQAAKKQAPKAAPAGPPEENVKGPKSSSVS